MTSRGGRVSEVLPRCARVMGRPHRSAYPSLGLVVLAAVVLVGACGTPPPAEEEVPAPQDVAAATRAEETARTYLEMTFTVDAGVGPQSVTMVGRGVTNLKTQLQETNITWSGDGTFAALMAEQIGDMKVVGKGWIAYMRSEAYQRLFPTDEKWIKMDLQALGETQGMDFSSLPQSNQSDPSAYLYYLDGVDDVQTVGREEVRGVETTHYRGTATFDRLKESVPDEAVPTIESMQAMLQIEGFDVDVWVDEAGLARRVGFEYVDVPLGLFRGTLSMTMELYDFGVPVDVKLPDAEDAVDFEDLVPFGPGLGAGSL